MADAVAESGGKAAGNVVDVAVAGDVTDAVAGSLAKALCRGIDVAVAGDMAHAAAQIFRTRLAVPGIVDIAIVSDVADDLCVMGGSRGTVDLAAHGARLLTDGLVAGT